MSSLGLHKIFLWSNISDRICILSLPKQNTNRIGYSEHVNQWKLSVTRENYNKPNTRLMRQKLEREDFCFKSRLNRQKLQFHTEREMQNQKRNGINGPEVNLTLGFLNVEDIRLCINFPGKSKYLKCF